MVETGIRQEAKAIRHSLFWLHSMEKEKQLTHVLNHLFSNASDLVQGELQGTNKVLELIEKMNLRTADEYNNFGDIACGLRVYVEQLKRKNETFHTLIQQIDEIDQEVMELADLVSMLDKYTFTLENKVQRACSQQPKRS